MVDNFRAALTLGHDRARLQLSGELDSAVTKEFSTRFEEAFATEPSLLLVDLTELSFCDSSGIRVLVMAATSCASKAIEMRIVGVQPNVRRVFELTDTDSLLPLSNDCDDQTQWRRRPPKPTSD
jgi:anti-sigma B factor antagonist